MINPSIESSDFLFWHKKNLNCFFENFVENRQTKFHILKFRVCVLCLFPTKFWKIQLKMFLWQNRKSQLSIDGLIISVPLLTFGVRKRQKLFVKWVKKCIGPKNLELGAWRLEPEAWSLLVYLDKINTYFDLFFCWANYT